MIQYSEVIYVAEVRELMELRYTHRQNDNEEAITIQVFRMGQFKATVSDDLRSDRNDYYPRSSHQAIATFSLCADHDDNSLSFGPSCSLGLLPERYQNKGIGSYCMVQLINKIAQKYPDYSISRSSLSHVNGDTDEKAQNRNSFYRNLGFTLILDDEEKFGYFECDKPASLSQQWNRRKIRLIPIKVLSHLIGKGSPMSKELDGLIARYRSMHSETNDIASRLTSSKYLNVALLVMLIGVWFFR